MDKSVKDIAIVTFSSEVGSFYVKLLKSLFKNSINIYKYSFEEGNIKELADVDLVVIATHSIYETIKKYIPKESEVVITSLTLCKESLEKINQIPKGTKAMLVNLSAEMALETISLIYFLGINHIELYPVYPGMKDVPDLEFALTPAETRFVPSDVKNILDIGHRLLDADTIVEIALKLDSEHMLHQKNFKEYFSKIAIDNYSFERLTGKINSLESQFDILLKVLDEGIIGVNASGIIFACNKSAERILGIKSCDIVGRRVQEALHIIPFDKVFESHRSIESQLIKIDGVYISLDISPVLSQDDKLMGAFGIIKKFADAEQQQHRLRAQLLDKGHKAKYTFEDIIGESPAVKKTKEIAKRIAKSDGVTLITGESGTGKELFAQAIHNNSNRKNYPFVAINCAAIPENLLESELFGYAEGAFSGAKKGGKPGLFEFAHMGTLFLDEIGEMSFSMQAKLLRAVQEQEVMRIGGDRVIKVDVRIIAATNRDLKKLMQEGKFRKDLYYRLNVLPLSIPPLRERKEDILLLTEFFKKELKSDFKLTASAKNAFLNYIWDGNVRELENCVEYLTCLGDKNIEVEDIPFLKTGDFAKKEHINCSKAEKMEIKDFLVFIENQFFEYYFVLNVLYKGYEKNIGLGRYTIANIAKREGVFITEQEIRTILNNLAKYKLVKTSRGRGGSKITDLGIKTLNKMINRLSR